MLNDMNVAFLKALIHQLMIYLFGNAVNSVFSIMFPFDSHT